MLPHRYQLSEKRLICSLRKTNSRGEKEFLKELETVYNRGFSTGFYFGKPSSEDYAGIEGSKATTRKVYVGKVIKLF